MKSKLDGPSQKSSLKNRIIKILYFKGAKSIPEISRRVGKTVPTTSLVIEELLKAKVILENGTGDSIGGRKPCLYALNPSANLIFVVNIKQSSYELGIFNLLNEPVTEIQLYNINIFKDNLSDILETISTFIKKHEQYRRLLLGAGVSMPGLVNSKLGINYTYFKTNGSSLAKEFEKVIGIPVFIENDTRLMTVGEYRFGQSKDKKNLLCINYDKGIGLGLVLNGELYYGKSGFAGEFGHIQIKNNGKLCHCGKKGCLETISSGKYILDEARNAIKERIPTQLSKIEEKKGKIDLDDVIDAVNFGDEFSINLLSSAADELGRGLAILVHLLNPEIIIVNGRIAKVGKFIENPLQHALNKYCLTSIHDDVKVIVSTLGEKSIFMGLISMVVEKSHE